MTCQHLNTTFTLTPELMHYGKTLCADCGRFLRWEKHPETIKLMLANSLRLEFLKNQKLSNWESGFVLSLEKQGRTTPKQQSKLEEVANRYGYEPVHAA